MGRKQKCGPATGLSAGGIATDWTSDRHRDRRRRLKAGSVLRIERGRPERAVANGLLSGWFLREEIKELRDDVGGVNQLPVALVAGIRVLSR